MGSDNQNFSGWSGSTFDITKLNFSGRTKSETTKSPRIVTGPVDITKDRPKKSTITPGVKQMPIAKVKSETIFDATKASKLGRPSMLSSAPLESNNLPFTAGTVDTSFPYGVDTGFNGEVYVSKVQSDGKILIGGDFTNYNYNGYNYYSPYLIRLNSDGSPDFDFAYTYHADDAGWMINGGVRTIDIQSDGKILIGGGFDAYSGGTYYYSSGIMRFNSDGTFDNTLFVGDGFNDEVLKIIVQPDGKILVVGIFFQYNNTDNWRIIRLNSNGTPDSSFITGDGIDFDDYGIVYDMILQPDGKIILGGDFYNYNGVESDYIVRLNSNGSYDNTFVTGAGFNDTVSSLALQSDGKIIVGGDFNYYNNIDLYSGYIVRLGVNGEMDTRFGYGLDNTVYSLTIQSDDKILVGGSFGDFYPYDFGTINIDNLVRFQSDCTLDLSFVFDSGVYNGSVLSITLDSDDRIYVGGSFYEDGSPWLLNRFGRLNNSILEYPYVYTVEACTQPLVDETITYVIGSMTELNPFITYSLQSIQNPSITVCGFLTDTYPSNVIEYTAVNTYYDCEEAYKSNNKLVIVEDGITGQQSPWVVDNKYEVGDIFYINQVIDEFTRFFVKFAAKIIEITPWSEYDGFFGDIWDYLPPSNYVPYASVNDAIEANGLIYEAYACSVPANFYPLIHKAYYDYTTILIPIENSPVNVISNYLPIGPYEFISGGTPEIFSTIEIADGESCDLGLTKIAPEGVLNQNFLNTGFDGNLVYTMVEQPDGKILVGGNFSDYLEVPVGNFMRINPDGSLDETFYLGQFNSYIRAIALQPDGKILVGGNFTNYDGYNAGRIIRLNSDGTIDSGFTFNTEFNGIVRAIVIQRDGKIVVGGSFDYYYDFYCPQIVRLNSNGSPDFTFDMGDGFDGDEVYTIIIGDTKETFWSGSGNVPTTYTEDLIVGGRFTYYKGTNNIGGIVKLSSTGDILPDFGNGFNQDTGGTPRVNRIVKQPDGKLIVVGGSNNGNDLVDYNGICIPQNMVRLVGDGDGGYQIDNTFIPYPGGESGDCGPDYDAGFDGAVLSVALLPNGKYMVGGQFGKFEWDENLEEVDVPYLVRLNSDGSLDETFTFTINDNYVNNVLLLSSGRLLVGGWFNTPQDLMLELFIGEEYVLRSFDTCDGLTSNIFLPTGYKPEYVEGSLENVTELPYSPISIIGLNIVYQNVSGDDDSNFFIELPLDFDVNFLGVNYTSVNVGTNSYLTFGGGSDNYGIDPLPEDIPNETGLPGVYLSTRNNDGTCLDSSLVTLYTGTTDGGNTTIIRFEGNHENSTDFPYETNLIYNFKFYKDQSNYFDIIIEQNDVFCNDDPTGGVSDGINTTWVSSFDSSSEKSYRISGSVAKPIKANLNNRAVVCGTIGDVITTPQLNGGPIGGSMYFDGVNDTMVQINNDGGQFGFGGPGLWDFTIEWFQYWEGGTTNARPFSIGTYSVGDGDVLQISFEGDGLLWVSGNTASLNINLNDIQNKWVHFAITRYYNGLNHLWCVYVDGVRVITDWTNDTILTNTLPLVIGNQTNNDGKFQGYITNFRVNNQSAIYSGPTITVPTQPLTCDNNVILLINSNDADNLYKDICGGQTTSNTGVTWSNLTPFVNTLDFSLFTATDFTSYNTCNDCLNTDIYQVSLYVRNFLSIKNNETLPNFVSYNTMTLSDIQKVQSFGPIFTTLGPESYEILNYNL